MPGTVDVAVVLDVPDSAPEGSVLLVRVRTDAAAARLVQGGEVSLTRTIAYRYRQEGPDGATHLATARRVEPVVVQALPPGEEGPGRYDAEVLVPVPEEGPPTADTDLVTVDWAVRARVALADGLWAQAVRRVTVRTTAARFAARATRPARTDDRGHTIVDIDRLSTRRIVPGTQLRGDVVVAPLRPGPIRSVRLELLLCERVPHDAARCPDAVGSKDSVTVVRTVTLASALEVRDDLPVLRLPFRLDVPETLPAPTVVTPEFEICWGLRAVVSRPLHRDACADLGLVAATVPE